MQAQDIGKRFAALEGLAEPAGPGGNAFEFLLLPRPLPFFDTLKDWR